MEEFNNWFRGFVDGEGSFHILIWKHPRTKLRVAVRGGFGIVLSEKDRKVLEIIKEKMKMGKVTDHMTNKSVQFRVNDLPSLLKLVDFFDEHPLLTERSKDFEVWKACIKKIKNDEHLTKEGILEISRMKDIIGANKKGIRTNTFEVVKNWLETGKV